MDEQYNEDKRRWYDCLKKPDGAFGMIMGAFVAGAFAYAYITSDYLYVPSVSSGSAGPGNMILEIINLLFTDLYQWVSMVADSSGTPLSGTELFIATVMVILFPIALLGTLLHVLLWIGPRLLGALMAVLVVWAVLKLFG